MKLLSLVCSLLILFTIPTNAQDIPLPEHPRPDFQRADWINLNGRWDFKFDAQNNGIEDEWSWKPVDFPHKITVPFPWGAPLSGVEDRATIGWYKRLITVPENWHDQKVYLVIGAADWHTTAWLDGHKLGEHKGGYTPFEFDLTPYMQPGKTQTLVIRVDDTEYDFKLYGKQGYGNARGIWQTVYLEVRPETHFESIHFTPDIDNEQVTVDVQLNKVLENKSEMKLLFKSGDALVIKNTVPVDTKEFRFTMDLNDPHLWSLDDPFLYYVDAELATEKAADRVSTYFGMRKISVEMLPGTDFPYVALNNKPVYLQMALDQAYHPEGYYTYPSDDFIRNDILRTRRLGLNGQRIHVKIDPPRKLYWADRLGVLIMADVPNSWGEPSKKMKQEFLTAMRGMLKRDFNHPSIFSWVLFNETWGLVTQQENERVYTKETQEWVADMYHLAKELDPTRLVEDNSPNKKDHVITDLNTWHAYLPGYAWKDHLNRICEQTYPGSEWNYVEGREQDVEPMLNSECGNVWGYKGSTGDVDWSYDYHRMINEFRRQPEIAGWLYTEHHDVINEWNGYYQYDRSKKMTGLDELVPGMSLQDWHSRFYISAGQNICRDARPGERVEVPLYASFMTDCCAADSLTLRAHLFFRNVLGEQAEVNKSTISIPFEPWMNRQLKPLSLNMPDEPGLAVLRLYLHDASGRILQRNFASFRVTGEAPPVIERDGKTLRLLSFSPKSFAESKWSLKQWDILGGLKVNGAGSGFFEYRMAWPEDLDPEEIAAATIRAECSAKQLFGKDVAEGAMSGDYMRGGGAHDRSRNPNAYPMTDDDEFHSAVQVRVNGISLGVFDLKDDPADHRGILSWHSQNQDRTLHEAGSYGYEVAASLPPEVLQQCAKAGELVIRFEVDDALPHGLAIYSKDFGRYPFDPHVVFEMK